VRQRPSMCRPVPPAKENCPPPLEEPQRATPVTSQAQPAARGRLATIMATPPSPVLSSVTQAILARHGATLKADDHRAAAQLLPPRIRVTPASPGRQRAAYPTPPSPEMSEVTRALMRGRF